MKNNNARINDFLKACERKRYWVDFNSGETQRQIRQKVKQTAAKGIGVTVDFVKGFTVYIVTPLDKCKAEHLPIDLIEDFAILTGQPSREAIETESEIIAGCRLLGASYKGGGKFVTACGVTFRIPLDRPVTAQEVRDAVIWELHLQIEKIPKIHLTRI